jgi:hypothetical protein
MAVACKTKPTAAPNIQPTSNIEPIDPRRRKLTAKPTKLQLDRRQYPRLASLNPAELVMARANHDTDDSISASTPSTADVESSDFPSPAPPENAPICNGPPSERHEYQSEYASEHGVADE